MATIGRAAYAEMFGPTIGDRVRLADTNLIVEVEDDYTLRAGGYGEERLLGLRFDCIAKFTQLSDKSAPT